MKMMNIGALLARAAILPVPMPLDLRTKEAPDLELALKQHVETVEKAIAGFKGTGDEMATQLGTLREQVSQIEQKMARKGGLDLAGTDTFGAKLIASEDFKAYTRGGARGTMKFGTKAITAAQAGTAWSERDGDTASMAKRTLRIRDLLTVVPTSSGSVDYARQTTRTNNAAVVAEGTQKPTSTYVWEQVNLPMRVIAHLAKLTRQAIDDAPMLQTEVDNEMRYGLGLAEEMQLLSGDGTGQNLTGLIPAASTYAAPFAIEDANMIDMIGLAILQQSLTEFPTDGIVLNPTDWMRMRLLKDAQGKYLLGDPGEQVQPRLFGLPVVPTQAMTVDKFLVGGFKLQKLYDRMQPEVLIASENVDDFENNLYTMRCEERVGLAIRQAGALVYGDFGNVT